jgi:hypothetical protein
VVESWMESSSYSRSRIFLSFADGAELSQYRTSAYPAKVVYHHARIIVRAVTCMERNKEKFKERKSP